MKKLIILLFVSFGLLWTVQAQDIMIRRDGSEVRAKILEINPDEICYKRFDNQEGPVYWERKEEILKIKYANGTEDIFVQAAPQNETIKVKKLRYSGLVELLPYIGDYSGLAINTSYGVQLSEKYFLGMGTGMNFSEFRTNIPFYATFAMDFSTEKIRPFFSVSLGMQLRYDDDDDSDVSLWSNGMFGYRFKSFYTACGISIQTMYKHEYNYNESRLVYDNYGTVGFMFAFGFKW